MIRRTRQPRPTLAVALLGATLVAGTTLGGIAAIAATAGASATVRSSTTPPWEPDADSVGGLVFYDAAGHVVTGGNVDDSPVAAYVEGTKTVRSGDVKATLYGYLPVKGEPVGEWSGEQLGASTAYPDPQAPAPLDTATLPLETGATGDESIADLAEDYPTPANAVAPYVDVYQLRLLTSAPGEPGNTTYDSADIQISGDTWSVLYSQAATTPTKTTLAVSPSSSAYHGTAVKLSATVTPAAAAGSVEFRSGSDVLKSVAVKSGKATFTTTALPDGTEKLSAVFKPSDTSLYTGSTSTTHDLKVSAHPTSTTLKASAASVTKGRKVTLTADESPAEAGSVAFYNGSAKLATVKVAKGVATYGTETLSVGSHTLHAVFHPTDTAAFASSTSKTVKVTVKS